MPPLELTNARLTQVRDPGEFDDLANTATAGPVVWSGEEGVFYEERRSRQIAEEGVSNVVIERFLHVDTTTVRFQEGSTVAFVTSAGAQSGTVQGVERNELEGLPQEVQTTRLTLEQA